MRRKINLLLVSLIFVIGLFGFVGCSSVKNNTSSNSQSTSSNSNGSWSNDNSSNGSGEIEGILIYEKSSTNDYYVVTGIENKINATIVNIPDSYNSLTVKKIGDYAFMYCSNLKSVIISSMVTNIGRDAFEDCSNLKSVTFGENSVLESIGKNAFSGCSKLTSLIIPNNVKNIGYSAFKNCTSLQYNEYDNAKFLGNNDNPYLVLISVTSTDITNYTINKKSNVIYSDAFYNCSKLTSITIPSNVTNIGDWAFYKCSNLESIKINENSVLESIVSGAFYDCKNLISITIPTSVKSIGVYAFSNCSKLTSVTFENTSGWFYAENEGATSGTSVIVTSNTQNATYLTDIYARFYWYVNV